MVWMVEHKKMIVLSLLVILAFIVGLWALWPDNAGLSESEEAALNFYKALHITGDAKTVNKMDLDGNDWSDHVRKSKSESVMVMTSPERPVTETSAQIYIYKPQTDQGYVLDMVKKSDGWKMSDYESERGLYDFVTRIYPNHKDDWKEVKLP